MTISDPQPMSAAVHEAPPQPPEPGSDLRPRALARRERVDAFRIERVLEQTATQAVYVARDTSSQLEVMLIEYLPADLVTRRDDGRIAPREPGLAAAFGLGCRRFTQHATRLTRFEHPSLPHLFQCWETQGTVYAAMKNQRGMPLLAARPTMERPPEEAWLRVLVNHLLDALDVLHESGVIHAGVSPRTVVLRRDGPTMLTETSDALSADEQVAAAAFIPPELRLGAEDMSVGAWTDLWGLAASLHYAITGEPPAEGVSIHDGVRRLRGDHPHLRYSDTLLQAIDAALAPAPSHRPQTVAAFRQKVGLPAVQRRTGTTVPGRFDPEPAVRAAVQAAQEPAAPTRTSARHAPVAPQPAVPVPTARSAPGPSTPPAPAPTARPVPPPSAPMPLTEPPVLDDAVATPDESEATEEERAAIHSALSGFDPLPLRSESHVELPLDSQSAHQPGAYEPEVSPLSRLRLLGIGLVLAAVAGAAGFAIWQVMDRHSADEALQRASTGLPPTAAPAEPPAAPVRRNRPITGPEGRDLTIPPAAPAAPARQQGKS